MPEGNSDSSNEIARASRALLENAIEASGLSARKFATTVLMRDERTVRRWLRGETPIPEVVMRFLAPAIDDQPTIEAGE